jgi:fructose-bisphosphate aldolase class I
MTSALVATARTLVGEGRGLLAMDESNPTCNKRFAAAGIPQTEEARRAYRELIVTTPGLGRCISGAILYDETIRQRDGTGVLLLDRLLEAGIIPGIKVDRGAKPLALHPGETVTEGLDGLRERLTEYADMGARFAKWRGVIALGEGLPTRSCLAANAQALARYAALCQEAGLVPIVEPEVLMNGDHGIATCLAATETVLRAVFHELDSEAEHGAAGAGLSRSEHRTGCGRRDRPLSFSLRARSRCRNCVSVRRTIRRIGFSTA